MNTHRQLDETDLEILRAMQDNNLTALREVSASTGLSVPAVGRRLQRMRASGVITADRSVLSPEALGIHLTIMLHVAATSEDPALLEEMKRRYCDCAQVQQCYLVAGDVTFILVLLVRDASEHADLMRTLFFDGDNVKQVRSYCALQRLKAGQTIPLEPLRRTASI